MMKLRPIVIDADGVILGGNMRYEALKANGLKEIPEEWVKRADELTEEQKKEFVIKDNSSFGENDWDLLANLFSDCPLTGWGLDLPEEWMPLPDDSQATGTADESATEEALSQAEELQKKWQTKQGQIWEIPSKSVEGKSHRLLCGDSLSEQDVRQVTQGEKPTIVFADPPYGISIVATNVTVGGGEAYDIPFGGVKKGFVGGGSAHKAKTGKYPIEESHGKKKRLGSVGGAKPFGADEQVRGSDGASNLIDVGKYAPIIGDDTTDTAINSYRIAAELYPKAVHIWWGGNYYANALPPSSCWIVWDKENTGNFADAELAWTNQPTAVRIFKHMWNGLMKASEKGQRRVHPTQKPVALAIWCFDKYGKGADLIFDPFLGSGMSMVAAEQSGRTCYGIEKSEDYCAVILERMSALGLTPKLTEESETANG